MLFHYYDSVLIPVSCNKSFLSCGGGVANLCQTQNDLNFYISVVNEFYKE